MTHYQLQSDGIVLHVRVRPRTSRSEIEGVTDGQLRLKLRSAPVENQANEEAVRLLSDALGLPRSRISLIRGAKSRDKVFHLQGDPEALRAELDRLSP